MANNTTKILNYKRGLLEEVIITSGNPYTSGGFLNPCYVLEIFLNEPRVNFIFHFFTNPLFSLIEHCLLLLSYW